MALLRVRRRITVFALIACVACAQNALSFQGETALKIQFVEVQPDAKLEVLEWGGPDATSFFSQLSEAQLTFLTS